MTQSLDRSGHPERGIPMPVRNSVAYWTLAVTLITASPVLVGAAAKPAPPPARAATNPAVPSAANPTARPAPLAAEDPDVARLRARAAFAWLTGAPLALETAGFND